MDPFEDVFPIENSDILLLCDRLPEGIPFLRMFFSGFLQLKRALDSWLLKATSGASGQQIHCVAARLQLLHCHQVGERSHRFGGSSLDVWYNDLTNPPKIVGNSSKR